MATPKKSITTTSTPSTPIPIVDKTPTTMSILTKLIKFLSQRGAATESLFFEELPPAHVAEFKSLLKKLKEESLEHSLELLEHTRHPQVVAQLLIEFLKELPEPLLTYQLYDSFIMTEYIKEKSHRAKLRSQLIHSTPPHYIALTTQLLSLFNRLIHSKITGLTSEILAPLFSSLFLRPRKTFQYMKEDESSVHTIIRSLIDDYDILFSSDNTSLTSSSGGNSGSAKMKKFSDSPHVTDLSHSSRVMAPLIHTGDRLLSDGTVKGHKRSLSGNTKKVSIDLGSTPPGTPVVTPSKDKNTDDYSDEGYSDSGDSPRDSIPQNAFAAATSSN